MGHLGWEELSPSGELGFPGPVLGEPFARCGLWEQDRGPQIWHQRSPDPVSSPTLCPLHPRRWLSAGPGPPLPRSLSGGGMDVPPAPQNPSLGTWGSLLRSCS